MNIRRTVAGLLATTAAASSLALGLATQPAHALCEFPRMIWAEDAKVVEGTGRGMTTLRFRINSGSCPQPGSVSWAVKPDIFGASPAGPNDYDSQATGTVSWNAGETTEKWATVAVTRDALDEQDETLRLVFTASTGFVDPEPGFAATGTIIDDDH